MKEDKDGYHYILGAEGLKAIDIGDLVKWPDLSSPNSAKTGVVKSKYIRQVGGRSVAYAEVSTTDDLGRHQIIKEVLIASLYVISNRKE
jgi:hypothetical protein